jgi:hypothetical protein
MQQTIHLFAFAFDYYWSNTPLVKIGKIGELMLKSGSSLRTSVDFDNAMLFGLNVIVRAASLRPSKIDLFLIFQ